MRKRLLAFLMSVIILTSVFVPSLSTLGAGESIKIYDAAGVAVDRVVVPRYVLQSSGSGTVALTAIGAESYRWQIMAAEDFWVNIYGETSDTIQLSYAMVHNMLQDGSTAYVRCISQDGAKTSAEIKVIIDTAMPDLPEPEIERPFVEVAPTEPTAAPTAVPTAAPTAEPTAAPTAEPTVEPATEPTAEPADDAASEPAAEPAAEPASEPAEDPAEEPATEPTEESQSLTADEPAAASVPQQASFRMAVPSEQASYAAVPTAEGDEDDADAPTLTSCLIEIKYVFADEVTPAATSWTARIATGSDLEQSVPHPVIQGYLPYIENEFETSDAYPLSIQGIETDTTFVVVYRPAPVDYTVKHYWQNLYDDGYTVHETVTETGLTEDIVPEDIENEYEGFYNLLYERPAIAADGSTEVEIYYDRYYYLMTFDLGAENAYGVEPVYARYDTPIEDVGTPVRPGYTFAGWQLNGADAAVPATMPAENRNYVAKWDLNDTAKVTVVFWGENADDEAYSYMKSVEIYAPSDKYATITQNGRLVVCDHHMHTDDCGYACGDTEHEHTIAEGCYVLDCTETSHSHDNCTLACTHTHTVDCYTPSGDNRRLEQTYQVPQAVRNEAQNNNNINGLYVVRANAQNSYYYLLIDGTWYCAYNNNSQKRDTTEIELVCDHDSHHDDTCYTCGETEGIHTHSVAGGCYDLVCQMEAHTHDNNCGYNCGQVEETHNNECYQTIEGMDSDLWTLVDSDKVTVNPDGSTIINVYYDRTVRTLKFNYNYNYGYQATETITAKWEQDISEEYIEIAENAGSTFWTKDYYGNGPYTNYFGVMPTESAEYYNRGTSADDGTMTYYGESLNGEYVEIFSVGGVGGYNVTEEDRYKFNGFTYDHGTAIGADCEGAKFYYTRNSYELVFNNGYDDVKIESVKYQASLEAYDFDPTMPTELYEPGSRVFDGWYLNPECTGQEYILDEHTMPADNLILYAKWTPVTYTVRFYLDRPTMEAEEEDEDATLASHTTIDSIAHGATIKSQVGEGDAHLSAPVNGKYNFIGWFYLDEDGTEKAFDLANMPVKQNLQLYAKWSSDTLEEYTVYFKLEGTDTEIAAPIKGSALGGTTKTFEAKGGLDLYTGYQECYFPLVESHSMIISLEEGAENTFTFEYRMIESIPYTVQYLDKETGKPLSDDYVNENNTDAIVTENFKPISGYLPDALQKRLVVTPDGENLIIFYYTKDEVNAYYRITHYVETLTDGVYVEYQAPSDIIGKIGDTVSVTPLDPAPEGFTYAPDGDGTVDGVKLSELLSGTISSETLLELKVFYTRNDYPYIVRYIEQGTGKVLADEKDGGNKPYETTVRETAVEIMGYSPDAASKTLVIDVEPTENVITFYYTEAEITVNYIPIGPNGQVCDASVGTVTPASETLKVKTGNAVGSRAAAASNTYRFVGWYTDEACTQAVDTSLLTESGTLLTPQQNAGGLYEGATYYAKFEMNLTKLTIVKEGANASLDPNTSFIFEVDAHGPKPLYIVLSESNNYTATITNVVIGEKYTVKELDTWSWRYEAEAASQEITLVANASKNVLTFENDRNKIYWLDGDAYNENIFD